MQLDDRQFNRLAVGAAIAGFGLLLIAFAAGITALVFAQRSNERVKHSYQVITQLADLDVWIERAEATSRGYLLVSDSVRANAFRDTIAKIVPALERLGHLTADNPVQRRGLVALRAQIRDEIVALDTTMAKATAGHQAAARAEFMHEAGLRRIYAIRANTRAMRAEEERLLAGRSATERVTSKASRDVLILTGILLLLIGSGAVWLVRRHTVDLARARDRLHLLNTDLEGAVRVRTERLERANDEIQRFAYIVSHDLRSPLVNIMGFTAELQTAGEQLSATVDRVSASNPELIDLAARLAAKEDIPEAVGFIRSSTQKMDRLINAILRLSREGRRTLNPELLPMDRVVGEIIASFEQQLAAKDTTAAVVGRLPTITSDRVAVEQILSNMIENAIKYGRADGSGRVEISAEPRGKDVAFAVKDNGRGVAPGDHERIFDLFRRSGPQDQAGEGLGLAHVRALAYRLGGTVTIDSALGEGSVFRLTLPITYSEREVAA